VPETLGTRLAEFASSLRTVGAIQSDAVEHAFASVARHRCVPQFRYGPKTITVPRNEQPGSEVLDIIYSHQSLLTSTGQDGDPPSSSSAPTLMARMLEALNLCPSMRVLEIGAGTGYNAALITTITKAPVVTVDAGATTAQGAAESIRRLGLDHQVTVLHGDGYLGEPNSAPYDRIIVTCGVAGLSPHWLDQLAPGGLILAPIAHGGVHPVLAATNHDGTVRAKAALWADFMPAAGAVQGLYHRRAVGSQRCAQPGEQVFTSGEGGVARGHVPHPPAPGPLSQRMEQLLAQLLRGGDRGGGQSAVREPGAERVLAGTVLLVAEQLRWALRFGAQQEHQPGQATLTRDLQLRVGQLRPVAHRGSVPEPDDGHIDVSGQHRLPAHPLRALVPRGEIRHVCDGIPGPGDRLLRSVDKRPASRKPPQLRGMAQEHPPRP